MWPNSSDTNLFSTYITRQIVLIQLIQKKYFFTWYTRWKYKYTRWNYVRAVYYMYIQLILHVHRTHTTCTYHSYYMYIQFILHVHTTRTTCTYHSYYMYNSYYMYIQLLLHVHTTHTTCTYNSYYMHIKLILHVHTTHTTCTYNSYYMYIQLILHVHTTIDVQRWLHWLQIKHNTLIFFYSFGLCVKSCYPILIFH